MNPIILIKKIIFTGCLILLPIFAISQSNPIDSLQSVLKTKISQTEKIKIWISLSEKLLYRSEHQKGLKYAEKAANIAKKVGDNDLLIDANICKVNYEIIHGDLDTALILANQSKIDAKTQNNSKKLIKCYEAVANVHQKKGNPVNAIENFQKALSLAPKSDKLRQAKIMRALAVNYISLRDFENSYNYLFKALAIFKKLNNPNDIAYCYNVLGTQYFHQENWDKVALYYSKSYELVKISKDTTNIIRAGQNLALIHFQKKDYAKALLNYEENIRLAQITNHAYLEVESTILAAGAYNGLEQYDKALSIIEGVKNAVNTSSLEQITSYYQMAGETYLGLKNYSKALHFTQLFYDISKEHDIPIYIKSALELLHRVHKEMGNYSDAYETHIEYKEVNDSLTKQANVEQLTIQRLNLEFQEQQQLSEQEKSMLSKQLQQQKVIRIIIILLAMLLALTAFFIYRYYKKKNTSLAKDLKNNEIIEKKTEELQILYDNQNRFFTNIAHELRTPITLISGPISDILHQNNFEHKNQQQLQIANRNINYLKGLVNQILDLSKIDKQELNLQISTFNFSDLVTAIEEDFSSIAIYKQIDFQISTNNNIELTTDGEKLYIIIKNLLANAFKFTNRKGGEIQLHYLDLGESLKISIEDNGSGINEIDLSNIFNRYFQSKNPNTSTQGGTGIGLAICKEYIELLQGKIKVESTLKKGSIFTISFPKQLQNSPVFSNENLSFLQKTPKINATKTETSIKNSNSKPTILIVEDNLDVCQYLESILENKYELSFAHNGIEAIEKLKIKIPDLILSDVMMPLMNGFEFVKTIKKSKEWGKIPVIILTALGETKDKLTGLRIGIDDYLVKPFNNEELQIRIEYLLKNKKNRGVFIKQELDEYGVELHENDNAKNESLIPENMMQSEDALWLKEVEYLVNSKFSDVHFNVYQLCLEMAISKSQLYRKIKSITGLTPKQYIDQIRYHQARVLLESNANIPIKRVAYKVGFKDEKNFSRNFKKYYGKYPSEYLN